jgi:cyclohexanone monooxygenase
LSEGSLFRRIDSWVFGKNIPGKKYSTVFFFAGLGPYRKIVKEILEDDLRGFKRS